MSDGKCRCGEPVAYGWDFTVIGMNKHGNYAGACRDCVWVFVNDLIAHFIKTFDERPGK